MRRMEVHDLRNIREAALELGPGLNVFLGRNAQGKTTLLEAAGLLARGRSFRTEDAGSLIRRGASALRAGGTAVGAGRETRLEVVYTRNRRRLRVDGNEVPPRSYHGRFEVVVYATDRLRVVFGSMRERRAFVDRAGAALWPAYRRLLRDYERVLLQRNAALESGALGIEAWDEGFAELGARLRQRRGGFVVRLNTALGSVFRPERETYEIAVDPAAADEPAQRELIASQLAAVRRDERRAGRSLVGPHRDPIALRVDGQEAGASSSGQARSLLLALTLALLEAYREERGESAVALLDDLDSELDEERTAALCRQLARRGQALVTTAHPGWAQRLGSEARTFRVAEGRVAAE